MASHLTVSFNIFICICIFTISVIMHTHRDFIVLYMLISFGFEKLFNNIINVLTKMYLNSILFFHEIQELYNFNMTFCL